MRKILFLVFAAGILATASKIASFQAAGPQYFAQRNHTYDKQWEVTLNKAKYKLAQQHNAWKNDDFPLLEEILRQFPEDCLPMPGEEGVQEILQYGDKERFPGNISWYCPEDNPAYLMEIRLFPCKDGSWLIPLLSWKMAYEYVKDEDYIADGEYYIPLSPRFFRYRNGKLTEEKCPLEELEYKDFANGLSESLWLTEEEWVKKGEYREIWVNPDSARVHNRVGYQFSSRTNNTLVASLYTQDGWPLYGSDNHMRPVSFYWNGERFIRKNGKFSITTYHSFGPFRLHEKPGEAPRGFSLLSMEDKCRLKDDGTGETVAVLTLGEDGRIREIEVLSAQYPDIQKYYPGMQLKEITRRLKFSSYRTLLSARGNDEVILRIDGKSFVFPRTALQAGTVDENGACSNWALPYGSRIKSYLISNH